MAPSEVSVLRGISNEAMASSGWVQTFEADS
jgi:hypothetical protein